jgi:signal transduction histidine kinase
MSLSFGVFMLAASLLLLIVFRQEARRAEEQRLASLADANLAFLERSPLPQSEEMAAQLGSVMEATVLFSHRDWPGAWIGKAEPSVLAEMDRLPISAAVHRLPSGMLTVQRDLRSGGRVTFLRPSSADGAVLRNPATWLALAAMGLLSLMLGGWWAQRLARPVQRLAQVLPQIGQDGALPALPHLQQADEIGDLARALHSTHTALLEEREKRRSAERLALLGRMATSLAHELRNPLAAVRLHAQLMEGAPVEEAAASGRLIDSEITRMEGLLQQWLLYARPAPPVLSAVDLAEVMTQAVEVIRPQAAHAGVVITQASSLSAAMVQADPSRLTQVLLNVLLNAVQAMPTGGSITLSLQAQSHGFSIYVQDTGPGFSQAALQHFGEPFFSEKEGGMGLGLSVAREIMHSHGGQLVVGTGESGGARVTLLLPAR